MALPFGVTLKGESPAGILELRLRFQDRLNEPQRRGWQDVVKTFVNVARCGALSGSAIGPASSGCQPDAPYLTEFEGVWVLRKTALDDGAATVLLNLCHWGHANVSALDSFMLRWSPSDVGTRRAALPARWPALTFELEEYELIGQTIAIDVEFVQPQSAEVRDKVNESIGHWFKAANWAGYADEHFPAPASTVIVAADPMISAEWGVSWYFEECRCSDRVFDGLVNCLERISATQARIARVTIGE